MRGIPLSEMRTRGTSDDTVRDGLSLVGTELMHLAHFLICEKREIEGEELVMKCGGFV